MYKKTKQRKLIIDFLKRHPKPQTAEMIKSKLSSEINLATIYRNLNFFTEIGLVTKSFIKQTSYFALKQNAHYHHLICLGCNKMEEVECHLEDHEENLKTHDFAVSYHDMIYYGYCKDCVNNK